MKQPATQSIIRRRFGHLLPGSIEENNGLRPTLQRARFAPLSNFCMETVTVKPLDEVEQQIRRIYHVETTSGIKPTVLDVTDDQYDAILERLRDYAIFTSESLDDTFKHGFDFMGVRLVRGLSRGAE